MTADEVIRKLGLKPRSDTMLLVRADPDRDVDDVRETCVPEQQERALPAEAFLDAPAVT